jgi:hypothetical protein
VKPLPLRQSLNQQRIFLELKAEPAVFALLCKSVFVPCSRRGQLAVALVSRCCVGFPPLRCFPPLPWFPTVALVPRCCFGFPLLFVAAVVGAVALPPEAIAE